MVRDRAEAQGIHRLPQIFAASSWARMPGVQGSIGRQNVTPHRVIPVQSRALAFFHPHSSHLDIPSGSTLPVFIGRAVPSSGVLRLALGGA